MANNPNIKLFLKDEYVIFNLFYGFMIIKVSK